MVSLRAPSRVAVALLASLVPMRAATAQEQSGTPVFQETVDVRVVNVEVVVTDRQGNRVDGLGPQDFEVTVDGVATPIDFFTEVATGSATTSLVATGRDTDAVAPVAEGETVLTRYLVFIDNVFSQQHHRDLVLGALEEDAAELRPDEWTAVVQFDGRSLDLLSHWTNDPERLRTALRQARASGSRGFHRLAELRRVDDFRQMEREIIGIFEQAGAAPSLPSGGDGGGGSSDQARAMENLKAMLQDNAGSVEIDYAQMVQSQVRSVALAAAAAMRGLSDVGGRKAVLLLAGGWPSQPLEYAVSDGTQNTTTTLDAAMGGVPLAANDPLRIVTDTANRLGYTLYPIDVPGFQRADSIELGAATDSAFVSTFAASDDINNNRRDRELFLHDSLESLAFETGGQALLNARRLGSLPSVRADTRDFYWLGFSRNLQQDDEHHSIEVRVRRPGLRVRARQDFLDLSRAAEADLQVEGALLFDSFLDGAGALELDLGEPLDPGKRRLEVPLEVRIPLDQVTVIESNGQYVAQLEVRISVMDEKGNTAQSDVRGVTVQGDEPPTPGAIYTYSTVLEIRNRSHKVVVGVQDILGGASLASTTQMEPER